MTTTSGSAPPSIYKTSIKLLNGTSIDLPTSVGTPLFVVGQNGAGKSGLMLTLYRMNHENAVRISAHRQTLLESNFVQLSPRDKLNAESNLKGEDASPRARYYERSGLLRGSLIISDLIDASNALSRLVHEAVAKNKINEAQTIAAELAPLDKISELLVESGIPIKLKIAENSAIVASKNSGTDYSIASLSDGERAALLIAGAVLTAKKNSLIILDEPERHLHASIVTPLLLQLISKRPDCAFVVSTHELSLPVACPRARTVLVRNSEVVNDDVTRWDLDILEPGNDVDDFTREAIIGARRKILFIEGTQASLDKPLYEILFPGVSIFPRSSCRDVQHAVASIRDSSSVAWVQAYGIVDQDQLTIEQKADLAQKGVFALSAYSVESLYYHPTIIEAIAERQGNVIGVSTENMLSRAWDGLLTAVSSHASRLAARMTEQAIRDQISLQMPDWKSIQEGAIVEISVNPQSAYQEELAQLQRWIASREINKIVARYPIRETEALAAIVNALHLRRDDYESAVRKLVIEVADIKTLLMGHFGGLPAAIL